MNIKNQTICLKDLDIAGMCWPLKETFEKYFGHDEVPLSDIEWVCKVIGKRRERNPLWHAAPNPDFPSIAVIISWQKKHHIVDYSHYWFRLVNHIWPYFVKRGRADRGWT